MLGRGLDLWAIYKKVRAAPTDVVKLQHYLEGVGRTTVLQRQLDKLKQDYDDLVATDRDRRELLAKQTALLEKSPDPERVEKLEKALRMMKDALASALDEVAKKKVADWMLINDSTCLANEVLGDTQ